MQAMAVGRFHDEVIHVVRLSRRAQQRIGRSANITAENDLALVARLRGLQVEKSRAEDVPDVAELAAHAGCGLKVRAVWNRLKEWADALRVLPAE